MKKILVIMALMLVVLSMSVAAVKPMKDECTTIQDGVLENTAGELITTGYNDAGYNYQAHMYNGDYDGDGSKLIMKWNSAWLDNKDCAGDGKLDRPLDENGNQYYFGSGAWLTNHWTNSYEMIVEDETVICDEVSFVKIVALPVDAYKDLGVWYTADDVRIGDDIWGQFAIIQDSYYNSCDMESSYAVKERMPGLGNW